MRCKNSHSEQREESEVSLQILCSANNAELRMTKSPSIFEGIPFMYCKNGHSEQNEESA
jgi:hypothetical protein